MFNIFIPFSRASFKDFKFIFKKSIPQKNDFIIHIYKNKFYIKKVANNFNKELISFGYDNNNFYFVDELFEKNESMNFKNIISNEISEKDRFLSGVAKAVLNWNNTKKYCSKCGKPLIFHKEESAKFCYHCNFLYFPELNPAVIVIIKKGDYILLTRKSEWKPDRYGIVAGFIEYGESAEEAVIREVYEETKLKIKNIKYLASQFWPFPYQLMLGYEAEYESGNLTVDKKELEEAKWFNINNLPILPPKASIARYLIDLTLLKLQQ